LVDPLGQQAHLELLQDNARHPADRGRLQVERAIPRLPDRAGDEPVRRIVVKDRHESYPSAPEAVPGSRGYAGSSPWGTTAPAPPPTTASLSAPCAPPAVSWR